MYICLCKAVTDHDIEASVLAGAQSLSQVQEQLEVSTGCGRCESAAQLIVDQALGQVRQRAAEPHQVFRSLS
jgi:bacterioferritin-associated ferredoxin